MQVLWKIGDNNEDGTCMYQITENGTENKDLSTTNNEITTRRHNNISTE